MLNTPKGWTGPAEVDGVRVEGTFRSHQVPLAGVRDDPNSRAQLEAWLRSYRPDELFDDQGRLRPEIAGLAPRGELRMSASPHANGGLLSRELELPDISGHTVDVDVPAGEIAEPTRALGGWLAGVIEQNRDRFRLFAPDETESNRLDDVFGVTGRTWNALSVPDDEDMASDGRVMEILSEHLCQGWLEGYLLSGRHGVFNSYEAFVHIIDSMFNQHAKWLKLSRELPWRAPLASLNYLLSSHLWRQDHNGFSHQDPGFLDLVATKKVELVRIYLPPDANTLLAVAEHCLRSRHLINVVVATKNAVPVWLSPDAAIEHCARGIGAWDWAGTDGGGHPDVILACAGDVPTIETLAAAQLLRTHLPDLSFRVVNVVDLMRLQPDSVHPHGLPDADYDALFSPDRPTIFAFHGYPSLVHTLAYRRANHEHLHVRGYREEGTTTTPFDMVVRNNLDRFHLVMDVIDRVPGLAGTAADVREEMADARRRAVEHTREYGDDVPEIRDWTWVAAR